MANGKASPANAKASEKPAKEDTKKDSAAPTTSASKVDGEADAASTSEIKDGEKGTHSREGSSEIKPKRHSLYVKGIPIPTSEDELKGLFGDSASKVSRTDPSTKRTNVDILSTDHSNQHHSRSRNQIAKGMSIICLSPVHS